MPVRRILQLGDPLLRAVSAAAPAAAEAGPVFADLRDTLHEFQRTHGFGRGISAVQIGEARRLIYMEIGGQAYQLRNPVYEFQSEEKFKLWDDCFSFPDLLVWLERSQTVRVRYEDENGEVRRLEASGAFSELLQHEIDHLDGVLAIDRALGGNSLCTRAEYERRYKVEYDAVLVVSFGGPKREEDVIPFLENVLRGKNVPRERMLAVAEHYYHFGGKSPINDQNRALIAALECELKTHGISLPVYWGNRNWHPLLADTLRQMSQDGVRRALAFVTSAFGSYSGCRQYLEDIQRARAEVGPEAPEIDKLRTFHNHPGFIEAAAEGVRAALQQVPAGRRDRTPVVFTAHSVPLRMADTGPYVAQLKEACELVSRSLGRPAGTLAYQSRSGPPTQPWLEPDIGGYIRELHAGGGLTDLVIAPIGFLSDHMEVLYDLDTEAAALCRELGINMVRAATVGGHPAFIAMVRELIVERTSGQERRASGTLGPGCDSCAPECCAPAAGRPGAVK